PEFIPLFVNNADDFRDRGRLEVQFEDAENILNGRRFYLEHDYKLIDFSDTDSYTFLKLGNVLSFENKSYRYQQQDPFEEFGPSYASQNLKDRVKLEEFYTKAFAHFSNNLLGNV